MPRNKIAVTKGPLLGRNGAKNRLLFGLQTEPKLASTLVICDHPHDSHHVEAKGTQTFAVQSLCAGVLDLEIPFEESLHPEICRNTLSKAPKLTFSFFAPLCNSNGHNGSWQSAFSKKVLVPGPPLRLIHSRQVKFKNCSLSV